MKISVDPVATTGFSMLNMISQAVNRGRLARLCSRGVGIRHAQTLLVVGGILGALAASSCCVAPLMLFALGISGAWIANLTQLAPYQPFFIAAAAGCLGAGYWLVHRARRVACADGEVCSRRLPNRVVRTGLLLASVLVAGALAFDFLAPLFL
jgi:mercuric ion transport protein